MLLQKRACVCRQHHALDQWFLTGGETPRVLQHGKFDH